MRYWSHNLLKISELVIIFNKIEKIFKKMKSFVAGFVLFD